MAAGHSAIVAREAEIDAGLPCCLASHTKRWCLHRWPSYRHTLAHIPPIPTDAHVSGVQALIAVCSLAVHALCHVLMGSMPILGVWHWWEVSLFPPMTPLRLLTYLLWCLTRLLLADADASRVYCVQMTRTFTAYR